jgi:hypothetical protein
MLNLDKLNKLVLITVDRVIRDYPERDKIYLDISEIVTEAVRQHAKVLIDMEKRKTRYENFNIEGS